MTPFRSIALLAALVLPAAVAVGQVPPRVPDERRLTLLQLEIAVPAALPKAVRTAAARRFGTDTRTIRACGDAIRLAGRYKAERRFTGTVTTRSDMPIRSLPPLLQADLKSRPVGRASRVFAAPGGFRVVIACTAPTAPRVPSPARGIDRTI